MEKQVLNVRMKLYHERPEGHVRLFSNTWEKLPFFRGRTTPLTVSVLSPNNLI
jgi:hypothetical protein